jgi:hypothetical protein
MRNQLLLVLAMAAPAAAQPVTEPSSCEVTISRAPDEVREAIEAWVKAEPRCSTTLDVRVVVTEGGFYMFARDSAGRIRERVVPDAQSAGVLVASWVADDLIAATIPPTPEPMPPSATPVVTAAPSPEAAAVVATAHVPRTGSRWLTLGATMLVDGRRPGLRGELDVLRRGKWTLGAILAGSYSELAFGPEYAGRLETVDVALLAALARTSSIGKWSMRLAIAAGLTRSRLTGDLAGEPMDVTVVGLTAEASILFSRELLGGWAFAAGPIVTVPAQDFTMMDDQGASITFVRRGADVMAFGGLRRRL